MKKSLAILLLALLLAPGAIRPDFEPAMSLMDYAAPVFNIISYPDGNSLALWYFDNDATDEVGNYDLIAEGTGDAPAYGQVNTPQGTHHLAADATDVNTCLHTDGNIVGTVKTIEFYWQYQNGATTNRYIIDGDNGANLCSVQTHLAQLIFNFGGTYNIHLEAHNEDQWYGYGITLDGANIMIYKDNVEIKDLEDAYQSVNETWHIGNLFGHTSANDNYLDEVHISDVVRTVFKDGTP